MPEHAPSLAATGLEVAAHAALAPQRTLLTGRYARLEPLQAVHAEALWPGMQTVELWDYLAEGPFPDFAAYREHIEMQVRSQDPLLYAVVDVTGPGRAEGVTALMRIDQPNRVIEVGNILFSKALQRSRIATEAMYLLARYVFDELGYRRYEWKCNALNRASRRAAQRLGFIFEGLFRQHRIVKGRNRDTAWFSMLDSEWPDRKARFERWLAPSNFDSEGHQRHRLEEI